MAHSLIHDIETRKASAWLKRSIAHLGLSMTDDNANATLHAISILRNALEDAQ